MDKQKKETLNRVLGNDFVDGYLKHLDPEKSKQFLADLDQIYNMLHLKNNVDTDIITELSNYIDVNPDSEVGIVRELVDFNEFYNLERKFKKKVDDEFGPQLKKINFDSKLHNALLKEDKDLFYFSHEDNKNLKTIKGKTIEKYKTNIDELRISVDEGDRGEKLVLDIYDNDIKIPFGHIFVITILNFNSELYNYGVSTSDQNIVDCYIEDDGKIKLKGVGIGKAKIQVQCFDKQDGTLYEKRPNVEVLYNKEFETDIDDARLKEFFETYLDKLTEGISYNRRKYSGYRSPAEDGLEFGNDGVEYKGWKLNYNRHSPDSNPEARFKPATYLFEKEIDLDNFDVNDQSVIDPFVIDDLRNKVQQDEFGKKYLKKPKVVKLQKVEVRSEAEKQALLSKMQRELNQNDTHNSYVSRVTGLRYKELVNEIKKVETKAIDTYGSELFTRVAEMISNDFALYSNMDIKD